MPGDQAFDTHEQRDQYQVLKKRYAKLYTQRQKQLQDYEGFSKQVVHDLIGQTAPAAQQLYGTAAKVGQAYEEEYLPELKGYMEEAKGYDTAGRREQERGEAMVDVGAAADASREASLARLESYGIDPSMTRGAAMDQNLRLNTALEQVRAGRQAESEVEETGRRWTGEALDKYGELADVERSMAGTAADISQGNISAVNQTSSTNTQNWESQQRNLAAQGATVGAVQAAKEYELSGKAAQSGGTAAALGQIGSAAGMAVGAYYGGPAGAQAGAELGGTAGTAAGNVTGSGSGVYNQGVSGGAYEDRR